MPNLVQFLTPDLLRKCAVVLGFVGIVGFLACPGIHCCMAGHLRHLEDGFSGFYFDAVWFAVILLSMAYSIKSNLWLKPLFFGSFATILIWWIVQIFRDREFDSDYLSLLAVLIVLILCVRGLKWPTKKKYEPYQSKSKNRFVIFIDIIAFMILVGLAFGLAIAIRYGIESPYRQ